MAAQAHGADAAPQTVRVFALTPSSATIENPSTLYGGVNCRQAWLPFIRSPAALTIFERYDFKHYTAKDQVRLIYGDHLI
jgi:hypothetical protein